MTCKKGHYILLTKILIFYKPAIRKHILTKMFISERYISIVIELSADTTSIKLLPIKKGKTETMLGRWSTESEALFGLSVAVLKRHVYQNVAVQCL